MFNLIFRFDFWLIALGSVFIIRQLCLILAAEQGRKHDLVKKLYKASMDFHLSVLVPFLDTAKLESLTALIKAIENQEYPATKVSVHIVATEQTISDISTLPLHPNVKIWTYPALRTNTGDAVRWLIERCMAQGGSGLLCILKPDDIIKPDFFQNIAARSFESPVLQGYVAIKQRPDTLLGKVLALSDRLANRIDNAGRYHLGMSCQLMDTGWIIKQEVLEMIPYQRGWDVSNFEYTLMLNLQNFRVTWAPNVVVYTDEQTDLVHHLTDCIGGFFNRVQLLFRYGFRLFLAAIEEWDYAYFEQFLNIIKPPNFMLGLFLVLMTMLSNAHINPLPGTSFSWGILTVSFVVVQMLSLFVARCKGSDYVTYFIYTPIIYALGVFMLPVAMINYLAGLMVRAGTFQEERSYRKILHNRFNETMDPYPTLLDHDLGGSALPDPVVLPASREAHRASNAVTPNLKPVAKPPIQGSLTPAQVASTRNGGSESVKKRVPREQVQNATITNGQKEIVCSLKATTTYNLDGEELFQLSLVYKSLSFSTAAYKILDQAYYELHAKLQSRGFTLMTCGSCGNFYNPSADMPGALKNAGVCLFGKLGKEVNFTTDAVTVLSEACPYHCGIEERETILKEWRNSLSTANLS